ncbi:hypothetical protein LS73_008200 [Helicobacter muridarum]|uniref:Phage shock protein B n=1 Tax=Helicobacter muridarum TaxID=216 RepID=A0A099TY04_9HELI|nr:hypothetical protein [Helicobacter muridarum]TLD98797.1 hypothetical protein LS73_008200 [Helicobacter muridarum]STQ85774.1 Uncharacterised protein [Helicobacter muridarum]
MEAYIPIIGLIGLFVILCLIKHIIGMQKSTPYPDRYLCDMYEIKRLKHDIQMLKDEIKRLKQERIEKDEILQAIKSLKEK